MEVLAPLIDKLTTMVSDGHKKLKGVEQQATFLKSELSAMSAALETLELKDELKLDEKNWRDHVREMAYDMEDCIDDLMLNLEESDDEAGLIQKTIGKLKTLRERHRIAGQMEELKVLAVEANERRRRYEIDGCNSSSSFVAVDPRMSAIYKDAASLIGIDGPREELTSWLIDTEEKLKVVSIVGFGGLGKTTLAKQLFDKIGDQFDCKAFVPISQRPNVPGLLKNMQSKLGINESSQDQNVQDIIDRLIKHLKHKRYFIVVDDLWDQSPWEVISCAFPENGNGSRIIVTTRLEDVACYACSNRQQFIYRMKRLGDQDSKRLLFNRISGSRPFQFEEVAAEILRRCDGLPLAIITIASLLASHPETLKKDWETIRKYLDAQSATAGHALERMQRILNLSYMHLPIYLRACFLYLAMYPEDHEIMRDDLVRQWVAEGFVIITSPRQDLEVVAMSYFNELINRSMIQPETTLEFGEVLSCRVHDMMLELILSKCSEDNFMTVAYNPEDMALRGCKNKVRRLSLSSRAGERTDGTKTIASSISHVRSLAWFGKFEHMIPRLLLLKYLRVLVIESMLEHIDLTAVSQLVHLKYLKVSAGGTVRLPTKIGRLVHLETLEVHARYRTDMPSDIVHLPRLSRLIVPERTVLPKGIKNMKSLCTLHGFLIDNCSLEDIIGLGELTNLRDLNLYAVKFETARAGTLVSSIGKLRKLRYLRINGIFDDNNNQLGLLSDPPLHLEVLELYLSIPRVPKWIGDLGRLCRFLLYVMEISSDEVHVLGALPSLVHLYLEAIHISTSGSASILGMGSFPVLEFLNFSPFYGDVTPLLACEAGAMPKLRNLTVKLDEQLWSHSAPVGLEHLISLEQIHVYLRGIKGQSEDPQIHRAESVFRNSTQMLPSPPSVTVKMWRPLRR